jgi:hypothetical protein
MADTARADPRAFWKDADVVGKLVGNHMSATGFMRCPSATTAA